MKRDFIVKQMLSDALAELILEKNMDAITVENIIVRADVSRSTFYRYFQDKYDLMCWSFGQCVDRMEKSLQEAATFRGMLITIFSFFAENKDIFSKLLKQVGTIPYLNFYWYFLERMPRLIGSQLQCCMKEYELTDKDSYMIQYHCNGILRIIFQSLTEGNDETPEELADIVIEIISGNHPAYTLPYFGLNKDS